MDAKAETPLDRIERLLSEFQRVYEGFELPKVAPEGVGPDGIWRPEVTPEKALELHAEQVQALSDRGEALVKAVEEQATLLKQDPALVLPPEDRAKYLALPERFRADVHEVLQATLAEAEVFTSVTRHEWRMLVAYATKNFGAALEHAEAIIGASPVNGKAHVNRIMCLIHLSRGEEASRALEALEASAADESFKQSGRTLLAEGNR